MSSDLAQKTKETSSFNLNGIKSGSNIFLTDIRLFVAGIRMPISSLEISSVYGQLPTAEFTMPSDTRLLPLGRMDRVPVHIFVRETMAESPRFVLMFEGYITSRHYVNSAIQRSMSFSAVSCFDILNDTKFRFLRQIEEIFMSSAAGMADKEVQITVPALNFPQCLFQPNLGMDKDSGDYMVGCPTEYLENVYGFVHDSGEYGSSAYNSSVMASYYANFARNLRLMRRYEPLPYFDDVEGKSVKDIHSSTSNASTAFPILYGQSTQQAIARLMNQTERAPDVMSPMDMLTYVLDSMEYEYLCITNPAYHTQEGDEKHAGSRLVSSCLKPLLQDSMPPQCNVMFRSQVTRIQSQEDFARVPTRVQVFDPYGPLAKLTSGVAQSALATYGTIQYYPSEKYLDFAPNSAEAVYLNSFSSELLSSEEHTGPWVHEVNTPPWFAYTQAASQSSGGDKTDGEVALLECQAKERFCRRQLLNSKYLGCQLTVESMFDPYITPGFPGVVFDSEDTGFAFAGHVISVSHYFDESSVFTTVHMNFVRHLDEACDVTIPNPLNSVQDITHNRENITDIYQVLLGSPEAFTEIKDKDGKVIEQRYAVNGANAVPFEELRKSFGTDEESATSPQNNPQYAYRYKRRNICTFEDYLKFMNFVPKKKGDGPEGSETILSIGCDVEAAIPNTMLEDRARLGMYYGARDIIPNEEQVGTKPEEKKEGTQVSAAENTDGKEDILAKFDTSVRDTLLDVASKDFKRYIYV